MSTADEEQARRDRAYDAMFRYPATAALATALLKPEAPRKPRRWRAAWRRFRRWFK